MARKARLTKKEIELAAKAAAQEALEREEVEENDEEDYDTEDGLSFSVSDEPTDDAFAKEDVFEEGFRKAQTLNTAPRYHIKKNSQFLAVKGYPYSWERLQSEFGEGYYQVMAKAMSNGQILKKQSEMVGDPSGGVARPEEKEVEHTGHDNMAYLTMMQQQQERAESRARQEARATESTMATMMQTVMQIQQQSTQMMMAQQQEANKQFQTLLMSMNQPKGPDPVIGLLTTLLTQKPSNDGFTAASVFKMVQDAESRAENRAFKTQEQIDRKANELAEIKAEAMGSGDAPEESGLKGLIKGFIPVITQMVANQAQQQGLQGSAQPQINPQGSAALQEGFIEPYEQRQAQRSEVQRAETPRAEAPRAQVQATASNPQPKPVEVQRKATPEEIKTQAEAQAARRKDELFTFCAPDIGNAMMQGVAASETAELVLGKLEKEGVSRQTVARTFTLEDFYGYAKQYSLPDEALPWLKAFYETIQAGGARPTVVIPKVVRQAAKAEPINGPSERVVAAKRSPTTRNPARTQSRTATKDLQYKYR